MTRVYVPLVTPLDERGRVCASSVDRLIQSVRADVDGLVPCLSTGEGWRLDDIRWYHMVRATVRQSHGELSVWAGVLRPTAAAVIVLGRIASSLGVDAIVVTGPTDRPATQHEIYQHFEAICTSSEVPVVIYHEAVLCRTPMAQATLEAVCQLPAVVAVKESVNDPRILRSVIRRLPVPVFAGREEHLDQSRGAAGAIAALANLNPRACVEMLADPISDRQHQIDTLCRQHGLYQDDWYRWAKRELYRRRVLSTDAIVEAASSHGLMGSEVLC